MLQLVVETGNITAMLYLIIFENKEKITSGVLHGDRWPLHQKEAGETCDGG